MSCAAIKGSLERRRRRIRLQLKSICLPAQRFRFKLCGACGQFLGQFLFIHILYAHGAALAVRQ